MQGPFGVNRQRRRPTINITSLIDVMFLLLIFFMVSSTFKQDSAIDITLPQAESATAARLSTPARVTLPPGTWDRILDTAEEQWAGPGTRVPTRVAGGATLDLNPWQAVLLRKV